MKSHCDRLIILIVLFPRSALASDMSTLGSFIAAAFLACLILLPILFISTKKYLLEGNRKHLIFSFLSFLPLSYAIAFLIMFFNETVWLHANFNFLIGFLVALYVLVLFFAKKARILSTSVKNESPTSSNT